MRSANNGQLLRLRDIARIELGGSTGVFFKQFGLTLASAIIISAINALTLSPALCALFLQPHEEGHETKKKNFIQRFYTGFNTGFDTLKNKYQKSIGFLNRRRWIVPGIVACFIGLLVFL